VKARVVTRIADVPAAAWDGLEHGDSPFLRHGFLSALEDTGSTGGRSGWAPAYVLVEQGGALVAAVAAFVKSHSYGEYIFDWSWASAAQRAGLPYYPKLVVAAPATPATGPRVLLAPGVDRERALDAAVAGVRAVAEAAGCSSIHWLFCTAEEQVALARRGFLARASYQFHWHQRGYADWDGFLAALTSRKRKQLRKERQRAQAAVDTVRWVEGPLGRDQLDDLDHFYRSTTEQHGGRDYLRPGFFHRVAQTCADTVRMVEATRGGARVAGALFFETERVLFGRYWGARVDEPLLHFEVAYYAGIDRATGRGLTRFEAGAQGEHKLLRGFEPTPTYSAHWMAEPGLHAAVGRFCQGEAEAVAAQMVELAGYGPYRRGDGDGDDGGGGAP
jgi:predicted N-acyltransferase